MQQRAWGSSRSLASRLAVHHHQQWEAQRGNHQPLGSSTGPRILDDKTREQAGNDVGLPFIFPHVALMPDAHLGKGATVGSVIPTLGAIIPAAVGVDIGCGMIAVRTQYRREDLAGGPDRSCGRPSSTPSRCRPATTTEDTATAEARVAS